MYFSEFDNLGRFSWSWRFISKRKSYIRWVGGELMVRNIHRIHLTLLLH